MSNHTPGPWIGMKEGRFIPLKARYCEALGFHIAFVNTDSKSIEFQAEANARLIAAAPELLEALQMVRDYVVTMKGIGHEYQVVIDAAIAKATGEA